MSNPELVDFYVAGARSDWRYKDEGKVAYRVIMCVKADPDHDWTEREVASEFKRHLDDWTVDDWATAMKVAALEGETGTYRLTKKPKRPRWASLLSAAVHALTR